MQFVIYLRTSTKEQTLGIEAQRASAYGYIERVHGTVIAEYSEHESGKNDDRPELQKAINLCERTKATLLIAKLDRLSRSVQCLFNLKERLDKLGVKIIVADMPELMESTLMLGMLSTMAQQEREWISRRTKEALAAKKAQGVKLGRKKGIDMTAAYTRSIEVKKEAALEFAKKHYSAIKALHDKGVTKKEIAAILNEQGTPTRKGGLWTATAVKRILERVEGKN